MKKRLFVVLMAALLVVSFIGCSNQNDSSDTVQSEEESEEEFDEESDEESDEKSNVSSDLRLCDTVKTALITAMMDPEVINDPGYTQPTGVNDLATVLTNGGSAFENEVLNMLGVDSAQDVIDQLKSTCHDGGKASSAGIMVEIPQPNNVIVYVPGGCGRAEKDSCDQDCGGLYSGSQPTNP